MGIELLNIASEKLNGFGISLIQKAGEVINNLPDIDAIRSSSTPEILGAVLGSVAGGFLGMKAGIFLHGVEDGRPMLVGASVGAVLGSVVGHVVI